MTGVLVPVSPSPTLEETVSYAVDVARETDGEIHLVRSVSGHHLDGEEPAGDERLLERAERRAREAAPDDYPVRTALLGTERYLASPVEHVERYLEYMDSREIGRIVVDPEFSIDSTAPTLQSLGSILDGTGVEFERAPVATEGRGPTGDELLRAGAVGLVAFGFYVVLGGTNYSLLDPFVLGSGVITALIAAALLRNVAFETTPVLGSTVRIVARGAVFIPYMLWEIAKANVLFAYVVLHPSLPIDPRLDRVEAAVGSGMSVTAFANSITLTPGTLTVDADGHYLLVHSLNGNAQQDLLEGVHERAVRYLFYGREAAELPGPGGRDDSVELVGPTATDGGEHLEGGEDDE